MAWDEEDDTTYKVLKDSKNQYKVWPVKQKNPVGWNAVGKQGLKKDCLKYIEEVWTDRSLKRRVRK